MGERDYCIFADEWDNDGASIPVCCRVHDDLVAAIQARKDCSSCRFYITYPDVEALQDAGKIPETLD